MSSIPNITPIILSGGSGTRLWPMSRTEQPKQFLALTGKDTMFQQTLARVSNRTYFSPPIIVANAAHTALINDQLAGLKVSIILEPFARNTAPAIALAALTVPADTPLLVMPSDHVIEDVPAFMAAINAALPPVAMGWLATFGIAPTGPETGYGYIQSGDALVPGVHKVARFVEKPDRARAEEMIAGGDHVWNGGIFLFRADAYLAALEKHAPDILAACKIAMAKAARDGDMLRPSMEAFASSPSESIDYAVMEKADRVIVAPVSMGWSDIGSWDALYDLGGKDAAGNVATEGSITLDTANCLIQSDGLKIATVGVENLIIVASGNNILILPRGQSQDVKRVVEAAKAKG